MSKIVYKVIFSLLRTVADFIFNFAYKGHENKLKFLNSSILSYI
jgi:hypothetical protein